MTLTEQEAKTKWCPHVRCLRGVVSLGVAMSAAANADYNDRHPEYARCIGSECMAWRRKSGTAGFCGLASR